MADERLAGCYETPIMNLLASFPGAGAAVESTFKRALAEGKRVSQRNGDVGEMLFGKKRAAEEAGL